MGALMGALMGGLMDVLMDILRVVTGGIGMVRGSMLEPLATMSMLPLTPTVPIPHLMHLHLHLHLHLLRHRHSHQHQRHGQHYPRPHDPPPVTRTCSAPASCPRAPHPNKPLYHTDRIIVTVMLREIFFCEMLLQTMQEALGPEAPLGVMYGYPTSCLAVYQALSGTSDTSRTTNSLDSSNTATPTNTATTPTNTATPGSTPGTTPSPTSTGTVAQAFITRLMFHPSDAVIPLGVFREWSRDAPCTRESLALLRRLRILRRDGGSGTSSGNANGSGEMGLRFHEAFGRNLKQALYQQYVPLTDPLLLLLLCPSTLTTTSVTFHIDSSIYLETSSGSLPRWDARRAAGRRRCWSARATSAGNGYSTSS